jgi:hypothetical protein
MTTFIFVGWFKVIKFTPNQLILLLTLASLSVSKKKRAEVALFFLR